MQRYQARAYLKGNRELGSVALKYAPSLLGTDLMSPADSEPPNERGLVRMLMRQCDTAYGLLAAGYAQMNDTFARRLSQQDALLQCMVGGQVKQFEMMQDVAEKKLERDVMLDQQRRASELEVLRETKKLEQADTLWKYGIDQVGPLIPNILNRILRKDVFPEKTNPRDVMIADFLKSMTREQFAAVASVLSPAQVANLASLFEGLAFKPTGPNSPAQPNGVEAASEEALRCGLREIVTTLLPWARERLKVGESVDPTTAMPKETGTFKMVLKMLAPEDYDVLVNSNQVLEPEERQLFIKIAETLNLVPNTYRSAEKPSK